MNWCAFQTLGMLRKVASESWIQNVKIGWCWNPGTLKVTSFKWMDRNGDFQPFDKIKVWEPSSNWNNHKNLVV